MKKSSKEFDPDELVLSQNQILEFCDKVITKWKGDPNQKRSNIVAMTAVRNSVYWSDEESLKAIWSEILKWTFELVSKNAITQAKKENLEWPTILEKKEKSILSDTGIWY